jgi:hypothetical protein
MALDKGGLPMIFFPSATLDKAFAECIRGKELVSSCEYIDGRGPS